MNILYKSGDILEDTSEGIVIPVNTEGVAGKGLAKQWATKYKGAYEYYKLLCKKNMLEPGRVLPAQQDGKWFLCFPTKDKWREDSNLDFIRDGMVSLLAVVVSFLKIKSVAIPAIGCGLGGLQWEDVHEIILEALESIPETINLTVTIYEPR